ncbi:MAG: FAD-binding oxidoreductase [Litorimonas sp.]
MKTQLAALKEAETPFLPFGMGRSYGDSNLNENGILLKTPSAKSFLEANWESGVVKVQAGLTLDELLQVSVPKGWFLPVTPGSKFVTFGGAVANNVHGKNHHKVGSFGNFITSFALHRTDRNTNPIICTPIKNKAFFQTTIGGLGLTGIIEWVEIQLKPIESAYLEVENIPYNSLSEFFKLSRDSEDWDYTVAWVDCFSRGKKLGRGVFSRANFATAGALTAHPPEPRHTWPFVTPAFLLNKTFIKMFNWLYRKRPGARYKGYQHYDPFFYPLDGIAHWNRLYGKKGFFQHQSIINLEDAEEAVTKMLKIIERSGQGSFLAVLKLHGPETSPGVLSFCTEGLSLALDFPNKGKKTQSLLSQLDDIVAEYSGRLYPAKDAHMSAKLFQSSYPVWADVEAKRDPNISSSFWRRVTQES